MENTNDKQVPASVGQMPDLPHYYGNSAMEEERARSYATQYGKIAAEQARREALAGFKNFHRSLCARFNYMHDEKDWQRDLVSLEEHIAAQRNAGGDVKRWQYRPRDGTVASDQRAMEDEVAEWRALAQRTPTSSAAVPGAHVLREGYQTGGWKGDVLGGTVTLHYQSAAQARQAFDAIHNIASGRPVEGAPAQADGHQDC